MRNNKPKPFPLLMIESFKNKLNKRAIKLDVNRSWLTRLFIDYGYRSMTDADIMVLAQKDQESTPHRNFKNAK